ncbi:MAG: beta-propeller domain-containing protein [Candidatus Jacksonbacteria bacterium]
MQYNMQFSQKTSAIIMVILLAATMAFAAIALNYNQKYVENQFTFTLPLPKPLKQKQLSRFQSGEELVKIFETAKKERNWGFAGGGMLMKGLGVPPPLAAPVSESIGTESVNRDYSATNIQVQAVDEADIIKTDGNYIYALAKNQLVIAKAYPAMDATILTTVKIDNFNPQELFISQNRLLLFGSANYNFSDDDRIGKPVTDIMPAPRRYLNTMTVKLYDISDKTNPNLIKTIDFEGNYLTSRKIGGIAYFVVNTYPNYSKPEPLCQDIIPMYREGDNNNQMPDFQPIAKCIDIGYIEPIQADNFITIASISLTDGAAEKETIVGSGQNVYASLQNLYIAQTSWQVYDKDGELSKESEEKTVITKFQLASGQIIYQGTGKAPGHILNQFSMDEFDEHFRIATTRGEVWNQDQKSSNNIYVLDKNLNLVGSLEDLAPGEKIYSARFMGKKAYIVTFKKVDPLFVLDLSDPTNPQVLGKLKIPGYSDYLHPYDENHLIGIGKDTVEAEESLKQGRELDFAWYQGVKMALFDVSDVSNPIEMHKIVIGDRGTDSDVLQDHKAFLFDREKNLLILPITLAEIKGEKTEDNQYGEFTFQGAYVYNLTLDKGFVLRGRVTHYDTDEVFKKSGYYFRGDSAVKRSLYIEDVLYTLSDSRLQINDLESLEKLKALEFQD